MCTGIVNRKFQGFFLYVIIFCLMQNLMVVHFRAQHFRCGSSMYYVGKIFRKTNISYPLKCPSQRLVWVTTEKIDYIIQITHCDV